jgi:predicted aldo/keto reductase-like oxidoreductase
LEKTKLNTKEKIIKWSREYTRNHNKIITVLLMADEGLEFNDFVDIISKLNISDDPIGAIRSLMTDAGNNYGKIFLKNDKKIKIIPELKEIIKENWYK